MAFSLETPSASSSSRRLLIVGALAVGALAAAGIAAAVLLRPASVAEAPQQAPSQADSSSSPSPSPKQPQAQPPSAPPVVPPAHNPPPTVLAPGTNRILTAEEKVGYGFPSSWTVRIKAATAADGKTYAQFEIVSR